jgi:hypothetical protein
MKTNSSVLSGKFWLVAVTAALFLLPVTAAAQAGNSGRDRIGNINRGRVGVVTTVEPGETLDLNAKLKIRSGGFFLGNTALLRAGRGTRVIPSSPPFDEVVLGTENASDYLVFKAGNAERARISTGGNVGIGTMSPESKLEVSIGDVSSVGARASLGFYINGGGSSGNVQQIGFGYGSGLTNVPAALGHIVTADTGYTKGALFFATRNVDTDTAPTERMRIDASGNVGIGTTSPTSKLQILGGDLGIDGNQNIWLSSSRDTGINENPSTGMMNFVVPGNGTTRGFNFLYGSTSRFLIDGTSGNVTISGTINAKYQDVAEWVSSSEQLSAGTVVVLDPIKSNQVTSSSVSYDTRVAGVISAQPGIALGERTDSKVLVATTGRVKVKVDASKSPIRIGDLLVTSDVPGVAMKSEAVNLGGVKIHRPGTLIGKALEPLEKGKGEILVLLSLQ